MPFGRLQIDGQPLDELITAYEEDRAFDIVGGYGGLVFFGLKPSELLLYFEAIDPPDILEFSHVAVMGCNCGDVGCWPLVCQIQRTDAGVVWTDFQQPHRKDRDYLGFGPFHFELAAYRQTLAALESELLAMSLADAAILEEPS